MKGSSWGDPGSSRVLVELSRQKFSNRQGNGQRLVMTVGDSGSSTNVWFVMSFFPGAFGLERCSMRSRMAIPSMTYVHAACLQNIASRRWRRIAAHCKQTQAPARAAAAAHTDRSVPRHRDVMCAGSVPTATSGTNVQAQQDAEGVGAM